MARKVASVSEVVEDLTRNAKQIWRCPRRLCPRVTSDVKEAVQFL